MAKVRFLVVFLGANDSCFPIRSPNNQCVPLPEFKKNLVKIAQHPSVVAQDPKIVFIAPGPVQESKQKYIDDVMEKGPKRTAANTKRYADVVRETGKVLGIPVLDLWTIFATKAGWKPGDPLPGTMDDDNPVLDELLADGILLVNNGRLHTMAYTSRSPLRVRGISSPVQGIHEPDGAGMARPDARKNPMPATDME